MLKQKELFFFFKLDFRNFICFFWFFWKLNILISDFFKILVSQKYFELAVLLGFVGIIIISAIFISPLPGFSSPLFLKIAYELVFGYYKSSNVFTIGVSLKPVIAFLCVFCSFYYLYRQWKMKFFEMKKMSDQELLNSYNIYNIFIIKRVAIFYGYKKKIR